MRCGSPRRSSARSAGSTPACSGTSLAPSTRASFRYSADAPAQVEVVVWDQPQAQRFVVHLVNLQERLPVLPIYDLRVTLRMDGRQVRDARLAPGGEPLRCTQEDEQATVEVPELPLYRMLLVSYDYAVESDE